MDVPIIARKSHLVLIFLAEIKAKLGKLADIGYNTLMYTWDYNLDKNWKPVNDKEWDWFLVRKINYGDFDGLKKVTVKKHFPAIKAKLDPGKAAMLEFFFQND